MFSMMQSLTYSIEGFSVALLSYHSVTNETATDSPPHILQVICSTIRKHLIAQPDSSEDFRVLAMETFGFLRSLSWYIPPALVSR